MLGLLALSDLVPDATFFGGTALCRTHLLDWRLSEDIDLLVDDAAATQAQLSGLARSLRREYPGLTVDWGTIDATLVAQVRAEGTGIRVQLAQRDASYRRYRTRSRAWRCATRICQSRLSCVARLVMPQRR